MEKLKLTFVGRYDKKKDGTPLISSKGKPYTSVRVKSEEHGDQYLSGFGNKDNASWKVGDVVDVEVEKKGEYLNFSMPPAYKGGGVSANDLDERFLMVHRKLDAIITELKMARGARVSSGSGGAPYANINTTSGSAGTYPERDETNTPNFTKPEEAGIDPEDLPF